MSRRALLALLGACLGTAAGDHHGFGQVASAQVRPDKDPRTAQAWERRAITVQSRYYAVRSDLDMAVTRRLAAHMDLISEEYMRLLRGLRQRRQGRRPRIWLFRSREAYLSTLSLRFDADPAGTSGMSLRDGTEITLAAWQGPKSEKTLMRVLRHEGFHQFKGLYFPNMPPWVNEGLAEVFEAAVVLESGIILGQVEAGWTALLAESARSDALIPFDRLFQLDEEDWQDHVNEGRGALQYAEAWAVIHFLIFGERRRYLPSFERFLVLMNQGRSWRSAFQQSFGVHDLRPFGQRWLAYLRNLSPTDFEGPVARLEFFAAGLLAARGDGVEPATFAQLQSALKQMSFQYETHRFGIRRRLGAEDPSVFGGPVPGGGRSPAAFVLRETGRGSGRTRSVFTQGLAPLEFGIVLEPDPSGGDPKWQLLSEATKK